MISLGTNVAWKSIGLDKLKAVMLALSQLKQRVIWKLKVNMSLEIPDNVMIVQWIPQNDILSTFINLFENARNAQYMRACVRACVILYSNLNTYTQSVKLRTKNLLDERVDRSKYFLSDKPYRSVSC